MKTKRERKEGGCFVRVGFLVVEKDVYTDFCINNPKFILCCIGTKQNFPDIIPDDNHLIGVIKPLLDKVDKRIDSRTLAERLLEKYRNNPPRTGIYYYDYHVQE